MNHALREAILNGSWQLCLPLTHLIHKLWRDKTEYGI